MFDLLPDDWTDAFENGDCQGDHTLFDRVGPQTHLAGHRAHSQRVNRPAPWELAWGGCALTVI